MLPSEPHRGDHVGDSPAPSDERGPTVDVAVPDRPGLGIARVATLDDVTEHAGPELFGGSGLASAVVMAVTSHLRSGCDKSGPNHPTLWGTDRRLSSIVSADHVDVHWYMDRERRHAGQRTGRISGARSNRNRSDRDRLTCGTVMWNSSGRTTLATARPT